MALDTRNKRASAVFLLSPWRMSLPAPDGTIAQGDRQQVAFVYAGVLATNVENIPGTPYATWYVSGALDASGYSAGAITVSQFSAGAEQARQYVF